MPKLASGRQFALSADPLLDAIREGTDTQRSFAIMAIRIHIPDARALRDKLTVGYYPEGDTDPPQGECSNSGFTVGGVLNGKAGWTDEELAEFKEWLLLEHVQAWIQETWKQLDAAVRNNPVWLSSLWQDE